MKDTGYHGNQKNVLAIWVRVKVWALATKDIEVGRTSGRSILFGMFFFGVTTSTVPVILGYITWLCT